MSAIATTIDPFSEEYVARLVAVVVEDLVKHPKRARRFIAERPRAWLSLTREQKLRIGAAIELEQRERSSMALGGSRDRRKTPTQKASRRK